MEIHTPPPLHPLIVVSREIFNRGDRVVVVPTTTRKYRARKELPNCVPFYPGECGMEDYCVAQAENIHMREKTYINLEPEPMGRLDGEKLRDLIRAIAYVLDAELEPR